MKREMRVVSPGPLTTVQDSGRYGFQASGFTVSGVADTDSMRLANILVGNRPDEGVLEMTMSGATVRFMCDTVIAVCGADISPVVNGQSVKMNTSVFIPEGGYLFTGMVKSGFRAYLAVAGGFDIAPVMGSVSTGLKFAIGGFEGRKLNYRDVIPLKASTADKLSKSVRYVSYPSEVTLRAVAGPQDDMFTSEALDDFVNTTYKVTPASDRMGIRLEGKALTAKDKTDIVSDGIVAGSVQIPSNGQPILLIADHQTTGGYAKIATVISADLPKAAQLMAGNTVRFELVTVDDAQRAAREKKAYFDDLAEKLR